MGDARTEVVKVDSPSETEVRVPTIAIADLHISSGPTTKNDNNNNCDNVEPSSLSCDGIPVSVPESPKDSKVGRVWSDGCFDMVHFGHANNLRQAKALGHHLTVGIHSDEEITLHKGCAPVFTQDERYDMVRGIKWVDQVQVNAPYVTSIETLDHHNCEFCSHGNDITTTADGQDTYQAVKDAGRYREVERTQGVSTTDLVNRMLKLASSVNEPSEITLLNGESKSRNGGGGEEVKLVSSYTGASTQFLATTKKLFQFARLESIPAGAKVAYVAGAFDILHPGHLHFLEKASKLEKYLVVGVYDDKTVETLEGRHHPIMTLMERAFSLLACKYVSDIVIGAPYVVSEELISHLNVSVVAHGKTPIEVCPNTEQDPYAVAKQAGIYQEIDSGSTLTTDMVIERILSNKAKYAERNRKKEEKEAAIIEAERQRNSCQGAST